MRLLDLRGRTAVVTGAASGIGRATAVALAHRGCHVAISDVNSAGLEETSDLLKTATVRVSTHLLDVADREAVSAHPGQVMDVHGRVDILVNNAGVALGGTFEQVSEADFEWLFAINFFGVVRMTRAFLPFLKRSDEARLVNVSSIFGIIAPPLQTAYSASKFAIRGFSESLRKELTRTSVGITVVHPGGVATAISRNARLPAGVDPKDVARRQAAFDKYLRMPPLVAGERIVRAIERRKDRVLVGFDAHVLATLERLAPVKYWGLIGPRQD